MPSQTDHEEEEQEEEEEEEEGKRVEFTGSLSFRSRRQLTIRYSRLVFGAGVPSQTYLI